MRRRACSTADAAARHACAALARQRRADGAREHCRHRRCGEILVSPVSAWEIGLLVQKGRIRLDLEPLPWFERFLGLPGIRLTPLSVAAAVSSSFLDVPFHGDPADRLLVATARTLPATSITRDARILSHAEARHLRALAC